MRYAIVLLLIVSCKSDFEIVYEKMKMCASEEGTSVKLPSRSESKKAWLSQSEAIQDIYLQCSKEASCETMTSCPHIKLAELLVKTIDKPTSTKDIDSNFTDILTTFKEGLQSSVNEGKTLPESIARTPNKITCDGGWIQEAQDFESWSKLGLSEWPLHQSIEYIKTSENSGTFTMYIDEKCDGKITSRSSTISIVQENTVATGVMSKKKNVTPAKVSEAEIVMSNVATAVIDHYLKNGKMPKSISLTPSWISCDRVKWRQQYETYHSTPMRADWEAWEALGVVFPKTFRGHYEVIRISDKSMLIQSHFDLYCDKEVSRFMMEITSLNGKVVAGPITPND